MSGKNQPNFEGGINIAMKLPPNVFDQTVSFYKDVLRLPVIEEESASVVLAFGANRLWLDRAGQFNQAEIWLEIFTDDIPAASDHLNRRGVLRRDGIEPLPEEFDGFWICNPADIIHLVSQKTV
jgi:hypothetical protein